MKCWKMQPIKFTNEFPPNFREFPDLRKFRKFCRKTIHQTTNHENLCTKHNPPTNIHQNVFTKTYPAKDIHQKYPQKNIKHKKTSEYSLRISLKNILENPFLFQAQQNPKASSKWSNGFAFLGSHAGVVTYW